MMSFRIRPAKEEDIETILRFNYEMALESEGLRLDPDALRHGVRSSLTNSDRGVYYLADGEKDALGQIRVTREWSDWNNAFYWWIQNVYVEPAWRKRGVYAALHAHVRQLANADGACGLQLYVDQKNHTAQNVYGRLGMTPSHYLFYEQEEI